MVTILKDKSEKRDISSYQNALSRAIDISVNGEISKYKEDLKKPGAGLREDQAKRISGDYEGMISAEIDEQVLNLVYQKCQKWRTEIISEIENAQSTYVKQELNALGDLVNGKNASGKILELANWYKNHFDILNSVKYQDKAKAGIKKYVLGDVEAAFITYADNNDFCSLEHLCGCIQKKGKMIPEIEKTNLYWDAVFYIEWYDKFGKIKANCDFKVQNESNKKGKIEPHKMWIVSCTNDQLKEFRLEKNWGVNLGGTTGKIEGKNLTLSGNEKPETVRSFDVQIEVDFTKNKKKSGRWEYQPAIDGVLKEEKGTPCQETGWYVTFHCNPDFTAKVGEQKVTFPVKFSDMREKYWGKYWKTNLLEEKAVQK